MNSEPVLKTGGLTAGITTALYLPLNGFAKWEKGILSVNTLMGQSEIAKYGIQIKELSKDAIRSGYAVEDSNKALFDTVSALGANEKAFNTYRMAQKLAKGGVTELSIAVDGMTSLINAYGKETTDANFVANSFFTAQKYGKTTVEELAQNVGDVAPSAKAAGIALDELLATMSALTLGGLSTDKSTTALKSAISSLVKPGKEAEGVLEELGIPFGVLELRQKGLAYTLQKLNEAQKKNPELLAQALPNIRAYTAAMALSGDKLKIVGDTLKAISTDVKSGTGLNEAFNKMDESTAVQMSKVIGELTVSLIELGDVVAPYLLPLVTTFGKMVHWLGEIAPNIHIVAGAIGNFYNGISATYKFLTNNWLPMLLILPGAVLGVRMAVDSLRLQMALLRMEGGLLSVVMNTKLMQGLGLLTGEILKNVTALWAQATAFAATPIGMVALGVTALTGGIILLCKNWDNVTNSVKAFGVEAVKFLSPVLSAIDAMASFGLYKSGGVKLAVASSGNKDFKEKTFIKNHQNQKGEIAVGVKIENQTGFQASSSMGLSGSHNMNLVPG